LTARGWIDGTARTQLRQHRVTGRPDLAGRQQAAEKQVPVGGQATAQAIRVVDQAA
jgi:hypothetical protein